jgi:UDP-N-acetylglucosamine 2-epimerase (non-hydrolysing)
MLITIVAGARPNFMKIAPIIKAIKAAQAERKQIDYRLVHTGQHYDAKMSGDFFDQLGIPEPDANLEVGGGTQAEQTAGVMIGFERELLANPTDLVLVVGDVNSTMACTLAAKKMCVPVAHVEAGIRSGDMSMPEEINRIVTDSICDLFFTTSETANRFLESSGVGKNRIHFVGNTMIDTLMQNMGRLNKPDLWDDNQLRRKRYILLTLHRPANVDEIENLRSYLDAILAGSRGIPVVFPVHPRTRQTLRQIDYRQERLLETEPMGYHEFIYLLRYAKAVITDSGGITEEATVLGVPCLTLRDTTERPETVTMGTNELVGTEPGKLGPCLDRLFRGEWKQGAIPPLWDGNASMRIVDTLLKVGAGPA